MSKLYDRFGGGLLLAGDTWTGDTDLLGPDGGSGLEIPQHVVECYPYYVCDDERVFALVCDEATAAWIQRAARFCLGEDPMDSEAPLADPVDLIDQVVAEDGDWRTAAILLQKTIRGLCRQEVL